MTAKDVVFALRRSGLRVRGADREAMRPVRRRQYLVDEWALLGEALGITDASLMHSWAELGESLLARWGEDHRRYHDERHLEDVLLALNQLAVRGENIAVETLLAAWFHDAVYLGATDGADERASAELAVASLSEFLLDPALIATVSSLIAATTPGYDVVEAAPPLAHLLDADLAIFASSPARYAEYAAAVREEYAHVSDADFAVGRSRILSAYLEQPAIYRTPVAAKLWESRARMNLEDEYSGQV